MKPIKRVYVAGPYSKPDPAANTRAAVLFADELHGLGFTPFIPHLTHYWEAIAGPKDYEAWLAYDFEWLPLCDALLRMPGESSGADREVALAKSLGIPVFNSIESLLAAREGKRVSWLQSIGLVPCLN